MSLKFYDHLTPAKTDDYNIEVALFVWSYTDNSQIVIMCTN